MSAKRTLPAEPARSVAAPARRAWRYPPLNALIGGGLLLVLIGMALLGLVWTPYEPLRLDLLARFQAPSAAHWLGTDEFGRDALSRMMMGARTSLWISLLSVSFAVVAGTLIGMLAGYLRGWTDRVLMMLNDALLAFPGILMALGIMAIIGASQYGIVLALGDRLYAVGGAGGARQCVVAARTGVCRSLAGDRQLRVLHHAAAHCAQLPGTVVCVGHQHVRLGLALGKRLELPRAGCTATGGHLGEHVGGQPALYRIGCLARDLPRPLHQPGTACHQPVRRCPARSSRPAHEEMIMTVPTALLSVQHLKIRAGVQGQLAVDDLSFTMAPGEIVALVGESGSGKTMAARAAIGLLPAPMQVCGGRIEFKGVALDSRDAPAMRRVRGAQIGMVFQEPMVSLNPSLTIGRQMSEALKLHTDLDAAEIRRRCLQMLQRIGIKDAERCLASYPHQFSGGMRQRIMLASVMLLRPALLIADEPTTALDCLAQLDVIELMLELTREQGTAILFISHDLSLVARYAHKVVVMRNGKAVEQGGIQDILLAPRADYTRQLLEALPSRGVLAPSPPANGPLLEVRGVCIEHPGPRSFWAKAFQNAWCMGWT